MNFTRRGLLGFALALPFALKGLRNEVLAEPARVRTISEKNAIELFNDFMESEGPKFVEAPFDLVNETQRQYYFRELMNEDA